MKSLTFITGNAHKAEQLKAYLGIPLLHKNLDLTEIQSLDVTKVVEHKAKEAYAAIQSPVLVDDSALIINALGKLPGPFVKYFVHEIGNEKICKMLDAFSDRSATAQVALGLYDGKEFKTFRGEIHGKISEQPHGTGGFGFDPILIPDGYTLSRASLSEEAYATTSPRRIALAKLEAYLHKISK
ncbi:MAG: non-canonical purine NTP pyrophosphatase [Patescibacteria group bacterium]